MTERDATTLWRRIFDGQKITTSSLAKAKALLESMNPESPLRMRLSAELEDIRQLGQKK